MSKLSEVIYDSINKGDLYIQNKREYMVITKARSHNPVRGDFTKFNVVVRSTDDNYSDYVYPVEDFVELFRKVK